MKLNIGKYSLYSIILFFGVSFYSCNHTESVLNSSPIQSKSAHVSVIVAEDDINLVTDYIGKYSAKDKHLPLNTDGLYESQLNYEINSPKNKEEINLQQRIIVLFNYQDAFDFGSAKIETDITKAMGIDCFKDVWGSGQIVVVVHSDNNIESWLNENFNKLDAFLIDQNLSLSLNGCEGYFPENNKAQRKYSDSVEQLLLNNYGFKFDIPNNFRIVQADSQFIWLTNVKTEGGFESIMVNIFSDQIDYSKQSSLVENRNKFTNQYLHNDEGTKISVSESGVYNPIIDTTCAKNKNGVEYHKLLGWYTELGTYRRGPFGRYFYNISGKTIAVDWFCGGNTFYNESASLLTSIATSLKLK